MDQTKPPDDNRASLPENILDGNIRMVVDDGLHNYQGATQTFELFYPLLEKQSDWVYFVEDVWWDKKHGEDEGKFLRWLESNYGEEIHIHPVVATGRGADIVVITPKRESEEEREEKKITTNMVV